MGSWIHFISNKSQVVDDFFAAQCLGHAHAATVKCLEATEKWKRREPVVEMVIVTG